MNSSTSTSRHQELVLACICASTLLVVGLVAAINLAVPTIAASGLRPGASDLLWIVDIYVVIFAGLVIPGGAAGDRFGRKVVLITGLAVFAVGAAVCAAATAVPVMLAGRAVTGIGAALVLPNCVGLLVQATAPQRRSRALAVWATATGLGGLVGNIGGGVLMVAGSWRFLFLCVGILAVLCAFWVAAVAPRSPRHARHLDPVGTLLFVGAIVALLVGIIEGPEKGWSSPAVLTAFGAAVVLMVIWVVVELRSREPMLDPRLFRSPALTAASLGMMVAFFGCFGLFFLNASVLQYVRGYSVLRTGVAILPLALPLLLGARITPKLVARIGINATLTAAFVAISGGLIGLSTTIEKPYAAYAAWLVVLGIGFALALPPLTMELTAALPQERAGLAGGLQAATRELGSALGIAVVGTVLTTTFTRHLPALLQAEVPVPHTVPEALARTSQQHVAIIDAYARAAENALQVAGIVTIGAGALVIAGAVASHRGGARH